MQVYLIYYFKFFGWLYSSLQNLYNFKTFVEDYEVSITLLFVGTQVLTTIALVWITFLYMKSTKEIAKLNREEFWLNRDEFKTNNRPFVFVSDFYVDNEPPALRIYLGNSGKLPAQIKLSNAHINFYKLPSSIKKSDSVDMASLLKKLYYVFPKQKNSMIAFPTMSEGVHWKIKEYDGFFIYIRLEYGEIGKTREKCTEIVINYKTEPNSNRGVIHDMQTTYAD